MNSGIGQFEVVSGYGNTAPFLEAVQEAADEDRHALGFFPKSAYAEFARRDDLYVLVESRPEGPHYVGHLLFTRRFPRAHVRQMYVRPNSRRSGLASMLINHLRMSLTKDGFTSIYARVAEDLQSANAFWDRQQFYVQRVEKGGVSRNRQIVVRCHELDSPQLFPSSGINAHNPLGLASASANVIPLYLLDLNVLFDLAPRRLRHEDAMSLFQSERMNFCRLAISNEIREELHRTAFGGKTDPMESYVHIFPSFPLLQDREASVLLDELASLVFPAKAAAGTLNANDRSDLRHLATAIQHDLAGLVTNDGAILDAASEIRARYAVDVVSPAAFRLDSAVSRSEAFDTSDATTLTLREVSSTDTALVRALLSKLKVTGSAIASGWLPIEVQGRLASCYAVWGDQTVVGYSIQSPGTVAGITTVRIAVDETSRHAFHAARILLLYFLEQQASQGPRHVKLEFPPHQSIVRDVAGSIGFRGTSDQHCLSKLLLGKALTGKTWDHHRIELAEKINLKLPAHIPSYRAPGQLIDVLTPARNRIHLTLDELETLLSPALLCLPGRPAVITPVQGGFAEALLGHSPQRSLLPHGTASLFKERHYLSASRTLKHFKRGTLILFYESTKQGGRGALVAIARVRQAYLKPADALEASDFERSVLTATNLANIGKSKIKTVTVFDNIFALPNPVPLKSLQRIGCGRPNDLITTHPVTDGQLQEILLEAFSSEQD